MCMVSVWIKKDVGEKSLLKEMAFIKSKGEFRKCQNQKLRSIIPSVILRDVMQEYVLVYLSVLMGF